MSAYRTRNQLLLVEPEAAPGTEETPTVAANAVAGENFGWEPEFDVLQTNEHTNGLDPAGSIVGRGRAAIRAEFLVKGSGAAGTAPEVSPVLRAAGLALTTTAAAVDDTAQAGAASTITLHAGASATDNAYRGMVIELNGGTGSGQTRVITAYVGSTKVATVTPAWTTEPDATSEFLVHANSLYVPASESLELVTAWLYDRPLVSGANAIRRRIAGAAATLGLTITNGQIGRFAARLTGLLPANPDAVSDPGDGTFDATRPPPFLAAQAYLGAVPIKFNQFSLDLGNQVTMPDNPAATYGYDAAGIVARRITGSINPRVTDLSTYDAFADFTAGTEHALWLRWGVTAGNRVSLLLPGLKPTAAPPADTEGFRTFGVTFEATGADAGVFLCFD